MQCLAVLPQNKKVCGSNPLGTRGFLHLRDERSIFDFRCELFFFFACCAHLLSEGCCDRLQPPPTTLFREKRYRLTFFFFFRIWKPKYFIAGVYTFLLLMSILNCLLCCTASNLVHDGVHTGTSSSPFCLCVHMQASQLFQALAALLSMATDIFSFC